MEIDNQFKIILYSLFITSKGAPTRVKIISKLLKNPSSIRELANFCELDYNAINHHIKIMLQNNVIKQHGDRYGKIFYVSELFEANISQFNKIVKHKKIA